MSEYAEVHESIGLVADPDPALQRQAAINLITRRHLQFGDPLDDVVEALQMLGIAPYDTAEGVRTDPTTGQTLRPATHQSRHRRKETT